MRFYLEDVFPESVYFYGNVISIPILETMPMCMAIDEIRIAKGKRPFFKGSELFSIDADAWYNFRLIVDEKTREPVEIEVICENDEDGDDEVYHMEINVAEAKEILDREMKKYNITFDNLIEKEEEIRNVIKTWSNV